MSINNNFPINKSQRQLRVGELLRKELSEALVKNDWEWIFRADSEGNPESQPELFLISPCAQPAVWSPTTQKLRWSSANGATCFMTFDTFYLFFLAVCTVFLSVKSEAIKDRFLINFADRIDNTALGSSYLITTLAFIALGTLIMQEVF